MSDAILGFVILAVVFLGPPLIVYPIWRCLRRAGFKPAWSLLVLLPGVGLYIAVAIYGVLAFSQWPAYHGRPEPSAWRAFGPSPWVTVSRDEARLNRFYGLDGFLLALYGAILAGALPGISLYASGFFTASVQDSYRITVEGVGFLLLCSAVSIIGLLIFIPLKRSFVPFAVIALSWCYIAAFLFALWQFGATGVAAPAFPPLFAGWFNFTLAALGGAVANALLTTWYWLKSKRVNVTYRNRVPAA